MNTIILYTTRYGSVEKAAQMLKSKMEGPVTLVNIMKEKAPSLTGYDNVILGGSIYINKIQKKMRKYIHKNLPLLLTKRVGLFICAAAQHPEMISRELAKAFPAALRDHALCTEILGYEISYEKMNFFFRWMYRNSSKNENNVSNFYMDKMDGFVKAME